MTYLFYNFWLHNATKYHSIVGALQYLTLIMTKQEVLFSIDAPVFVLLVDSTSPNAVAATRMEYSKVFASERI